jgi:hypothetical protein
LKEEVDGLVVDPILRVIEKNAHRFGRQPLPASGVIREEISEVYFSDLLIVIFEGLPRLAFGERFDALARRGRSYACCHVRAPFIIWWLS